jgi:alkylhydroperoxidase family enzyme
MLQVEGVSAAGVASLLDDPNHPELDPVDRLVVEYATRVTETPGRIQDALFERLRAHFSDPQIVELTWRIALCGAFNRFNDVLQLEIEPEAEQALRSVG